MKFPAWKIFLLLALVLAMASEFYAHVITPSQEKQVKNAQEKLFFLENQIRQSLQAISEIKTDTGLLAFFTQPGLKKKGFSFFFFEQDSLKYWSENEVNFSARDLPETFTDGILLELPGGLYEGFAKTKGSERIVGLLLLRRNYSYENRYLVSHFNLQFGLSEKFKPAAGAGAYQLKSQSGRPLLSIDYSGEIPGLLPFNVQAWLYFFAYLFLIFGACFFLKGSASIKKFHFGFFALLLFLVRWLMIRFHLPGEMYYTDFFGPKAYASSFFFNSIGDLFLNAFTLFCFLEALHQHVKTKGSAFSPGKGMVLLLTFLLSMLLLVILYIHYLVAGIVLNSKITFDITNAAGLDANTLAAALSILFLLWTFYLLASICMHPFRGVMIHRYNFFYAMAGSLLLYFGILIWSGSYRNEMLFHPVQLILGILIFLAIAFREKLFPVQKFEYRLLILVFLAVYASYTIDHYGRQRELEKQKLFGQRLDTRQDHLAEYLFEDAQKLIRRDPVLRNMLVRNSGEDSISKRILQNYFTGYWNKFDIAVSVFDNTGMPLFKNGADSLSGYVRTAELRGLPTEAYRLYFLPHESGRISYLSILPVEEARDSVTVLGTLVLRFSSRIMEPGEGFPELFLSSRLAATRETENYSFARYTNDTIGYAYGDFPYSIHAGIFPKGQSGQFNRDGYRHVLYRPDAGSLIVVSREQEDYLDTLSFFTYVLIFFLLFFLGANLVNDILFEKKYYQYSLKQRIRSSLIFLVVISFILIATGTSVYIIRKYDSDQTKNILSRLNAIWFALTDRFTFDEDISKADQEIWRDGLNQLVSSFNLDYNLYDAGGNLFYSSQPKLFDRGIISPRIHPKAHFEISRYGHTQFLQPELIGKLKYVAAYAPFTDASGKITGYLNLPYFEKQNELNREISGFISALINIYMLLLVLSLLLALVVSSRITQPLLLMQEKLGSIRLGSRSEPIEWKRNDEIGQLVKEYNRMVEELAESADKLARSERESAWREMAQQVAHEIKNPLTPMKLSVQHLQKAWSEKSGNLDQLFERISNTLIEQIHSLSNIASEFSNFAQMPRANKEVMDLKEVLESSISLFRQTPQVNVTLWEDGGRCNVYADREQLTRIFSNLLKNAVQSIPEGRKGDIKVALVVENGSCTVSVRDNGIGIPGDLQTKIFTPSFTTKSGGMGLGLAMVKSLAESFGGRVWFETKEGEGSVFYVSLPGE